MFPKTWKVKNKPTFWRQNAGGSKKHQSFRALSCQATQSPEFVLGTLQRLRSKTFVFWYPAWFWQGFVPKCCQNTGKSKKTKFWFQNAGGYQKTKFESVELPSYPMPCFLFDVFGGEPPWLWQSFAPKCSQTQKGTKNTNKVIGP